MRLLGLASRNIASDSHHVKFLKANTIQSIDYSDIHEFKKGAEQLDAQKIARLGESPASVKRSETHYTAEDGMQLRALIYQPVTPTAEGVPLVVLFHGGGFCIGIPEDEEETARNIVNAFGATCVSCAYRLAPRFKFPYAAKDGWSALKWAAVNAKSWGADPAVGFAVGGTSAGANLAAVTAFLARDHNLSPPLTGLYLAVPLVCGESVLPEKLRDRFMSYEQNKDALVLPRAAIDMFIRAYEPNFEDAILCEFRLLCLGMEERIVLTRMAIDSVLNHPKGHKDLPPTFLQINGMDPLRDEAMIFADVLEENSVKVKLEIYPGVPHCHWIFFPFLQASVKFREDQVEGFGWLLNQKPRLLEV